VSSVFQGFTFAAAIIIGSSQLNTLLGLQTERSSYVFITLFRIGKRLGDTHAHTLVMSICSVLLLVAFKRLRKVKTENKVVRAVKAVPGTLVLVVLASIVVWLTGWDADGIKIVGDVPSGLPSPVAVFTSTFLDDTRLLLPSAFVISAVGFMESVSIAKATGLKHEANIDASQVSVGCVVTSVRSARMHDTRGRNPMHTCRSCWLWVLPTWVARSFAPSL
jgi:SulP family sulfate permease